MQSNSKRRNYDYENIIERKLNKIRIEKLSKTSGFCKRVPKKITPQSLIVGFFLMIFTSENSSYRNWASKIGLLIKENVSKQALWKRMKVEQVIFLQKVLSDAVSDSIEDIITNPVLDKLKCFSDVLLVDSTHIKLNEKLSKDYPGNGNGNTKTEKAILKIQATYSLLKERFVKFDITNFRKNDQGYSGNIIEIAKEGNLIIRDLGYHILKVFRKIKEKGMYFISRLKYGVKIYSEDENVIDLAKMLKKRGQVDMKILLGEKERLPVRLVAVPLGKSVASERRRKARADRDKRYNHSKTYYYLLGWEIFITNVNIELLTMKDISDIYRIRWRIEILFKCWKSHFRITKLLKDANKIRVESFVYCMLLFITLFQVIYYNYSVEGINTEKYKGISILKFSEFIVDNIMILILFEYCKHVDYEEFIHQQIYYYCSYESRKRKNYYQKLEELS